MRSAAPLKALISGPIKGFKAINAVNALKAAAVRWLRLWWFLLSFRPKRSGVEKSFSLEFRV